MRGPPCPSNRSLNKKIAIVTGANSGIGKEIAKDFSQRGYICRLYYIRRVYVNITI